VLNLLAMIKNSKGDNGHPCLSPLEGPRFEVDPLIRATKEIEDKHPII